MPIETRPRFEKLSGRQECVDSPSPGQRVYDECISISGWIFAAHRDPSACRVRAWVDGRTIGETRVLFVRPDVSEVLSLPREVPTGFRFLARLAAPIDAPHDALIELSASWSGDDAEYYLGTVQVHLVPALLGERPHGEVVFPENETLLHRENIYGSGPPIEEPGMEVMNLLRQYLPAQSSVVDVGCGAGAYGPPLIADGHAWLGLEANLHCCQILQRRALPFRRVDLETRDLPCTDTEWDTAICVEVLEHVKDPDVFLREIARIIRVRALFSVPNIEVLPYFHGWGVVPWHILEGDHKNFFTRASLRHLLARFFRRVEVFSYAEHSLRTREDIPIHVHLFAVADK